MEKNKLITFLDPIGRTILAEQVKLTDTVLQVKNPVILHVQPTPQGQLNIQTVPLYFREFLGQRTKETGSHWQYAVTNIVLGLEIDNEERLVKAYHDLWAPQPVANHTPKVVKLFDSAD